MPSIPEIPSPAEGGDGTGDHANRVERQIEEARDAIAQVANWSAGTTLKQRMQVAQNVIARIPDVPARRAAKLALFAQWCEGGEDTEKVDRFRFDLNSLHMLAKTGDPLRKKDLENPLDFTLPTNGFQAVVLPEEDWVGWKDDEGNPITGAFNIVLASGQRVLIGPDNLDAGDVLIIYPEELGDEESEAPDESGDGESGAE